ncbi:uncharacterized protein EI90DRAFT_3065775 [Cantharellus anzutake]|uniref:uncharacterized protein n=1 Tax=Cantharellus anzutake TaxID=1750568 RepID=UPI001905D8CD|nr:uncharacterized protein EI90DRAFT_3065775 [Cantharellus anzutake]KAF8328164.1 hypothetical protein EI90DRAFT_3065775 [Cantharellus anzutake]
MTDLTGTIEKELSNRIRKLLEQVLLLKLHPRSLVQVTIQLQESTRSTSKPRGELKGFLHGSVVAAMINAASCCLLDASSIATGAMVCAVGIGRKRTTGALEVDPDPVDERCESIGCFAFVYRQGNEGDIAWVEKGVAPLR